jgi:hypothetical protein
MALTNFEELVENHKAKMPTLYMTSSLMKQWHKVLADEYEHHCKENNIAQPTFIVDASDWRNPIKINNPTL